MVKSFSAFLMLVIFTGCSSLRAKTRAPSQIKFERVWARETVDPTYLGLRQPATISPAVQGNFVISGNSIDGIRAFDRYSGQRRWDFPLRNGAEGLYFDESLNVYFGANNGQFYFLKGETGRVEWNYALNAESTSSPLVQGPYIYHMAMNGALYCMEKESGRVLWVKSRPPKDNITVRGTTPPVFVDGKVVVGYSDGYLIAYTAVDGATVWEKNLGDNRKYNDVDPRPVVTDNCILVANASEALYCIDRVNGNIKWQVDEGGSSQPVSVVGQNVYYSLANSLLKIDLSSGKVLKKYDYDKNLGILTSAIPYKNWLIFGFSEGPLVLMDPENGQWIDTFYPGRGITARPTVFKNSGEVFITSNQANVYKLRIVKKNKNPQSAPVTL